MLTPTQKLLQITPGPFTLGTYKVSPEQLATFQSGELQAAVMILTPDMKDGEIGGLIAMCGPAADPASNREAVLFAAAPEMFDALVNLVELYANDYRRMNEVPGLRDIVEAAKAATHKARIGDQALQEGMARIAARAANACPDGTCAADDPECQYGFGQNHWKE